MNCDGFETELFFTPEGKFITGWSLNDANFRHEYMEDLFTHMGYETVEADMNDDVVKEPVRKALLNFGFNESDLD